MKLLVTQSCCYADEFDTSGFLILTQEEWNWATEVARSKFEEKGRQDPVEIYFGTNESIEFDDLQDYLSHFKVVELQDRDAHVIEKYLGKSYGTVLLIE